MFLNEIFKEAPKLKIQGVALDCQQVKTGYIFFAIDGTLQDGHAFIEEAIRKGASVIVHSKEVKNKRRKIVYIQASHVMNVLNYVLKIFYQDPSKYMYVIGISGTNGKTSVAKLIYELNQHFEKTGYLGTLGMQYEGYINETTFTTLDAISLNQSIAQMNQQHVKTLALEVSSTGLSLGKVDSIHFDLVIFTNLTQEHLDHYTTVDKSLECKLKLFKHRKGILNCDDPHFEVFAQECSEYVTYGMSESATYQIREIVIDKDFSSFQLRVDAHDYAITTKLLGQHNIYNLTAAIAALHQKGILIAEILKHIEKIQSIEGRLIRVDNQYHLNIFVDHAHTPDGFEKVFTYAKQTLQENQRLIAVFGSVGKKELSKRSFIGEVADRYCDQIILTEDDCYGEDLKEIVNDIKKGIKNTTTLFVEDRMMAIRIAINNANPQDTILVLGKGNEKFIHRKNGKEHWMGDVEAILEILKNKENENELQ